MGTQVLVTEEGIVRRVEEMTAGDLVYDPFADTYCEITKIMSRSLSWKECVVRGASDNSPICISKSSLGRNLPLADVVVSPGQIMQVVRQAGPSSRYNILERQVARDFLELDGVNISPVWGRVTYFALFTQNRQILSVSGLHIETLSTAIVDAPDRRPAASQIRVIH